MPLSQQKLREITFHLVYSDDFSKADDEDMLSFIMQQFLVTKKDVRSALENKSAVLEKLSEIDALIRGASKAYEFERIPRIERNILRLGVYELFYSPLIPPKVAISEAIRLTRKFASPEGSHFVNAILDALYKNKFNANGANPV